MKRSMFFGLGMTAAIALISAGIALLLVSPQQPPPAPVTPRRTTLTDSAGNPINYFSVQNLDVVGGEATIDVDTITPSVTQNSWDNRPIGFRNNSGVWQFQNYSTSWKDIGTGGGVEYALSGNGSGVLAEGTFTAPTGIVTGATYAFSIYGVVLVRQWDRAESFYRQIDAEYSKTMVDFGKNASGQLTLTIGEDTFTGSRPVFSDLNENIPVQVGVVAYDDGGWYAFFVAEGVAQAEDVAAFTFPNFSSTIETHQLGSGLDGEVFYLGVTQGQQFKANDYPEVFTENVSLCFSECKLFYQFAEGEGTVTINNLDEWRPSVTPYTLTLVDGTWKRYANGY